MARYYGGVPWGSVPGRRGEANIQKTMDFVSPFAEGLLHGRDNDLAVTLSGVHTTIRELREHVLQRHGLTPRQFYDLRPGRQNSLYDKIERHFRQRGTETQKSNRVREAQAERTELHVALRQWAVGPLRLEHPQGSSYHHLVEYDRVVIQEGFHTMADIAEQYGQPELMVVENDWGAALAGVAGVDNGEVRMPFPHACWEFRISGVRVLCFVRTHETSFDTTLFCVYGRGGVWCADDYSYRVDGSRIVGAPHYNKNINHEFAAVASLVWRTVRASCIMLDARVARDETVEPSQKLVERRVSEKRAPPRTYQVVRLLRETKRHHERGALPGMGRVSAPQGGHLRRGTWVHYDDQDSGKEQIVNDGGFVVSRTWRHWHFAGDLSRMIEREYRL